MRRYKPKPDSPFRYFKSSPEVIRLVVMMYVRFPLSLRNVEDLLFERGIDICHEIVRLWWNRFGPMFAAHIRRQRVSRMRGLTHWRWHLDEMFVKINSERHYLWRAVDHEGEVLESYVTKKRDNAAALKFLKKALKRHGRAEKIVTDGLRSCPAAMRDKGNLDRREMGRWRNNRAENSHLPFRRRERAMQRFRRMESIQKFVSVHASVHNHFNSERHLVDRQTYKARRSAALAEWQSLTAWPHPDDIRLNHAEQSFSVKGPICADLLPVFEYFQALRDMHFVRVIVELRSGKAGKARAKFNASLMGIYEALLPTRWMIGDSFELLASAFLQMPMKFLREDLARAERNAEARKPALLAQPVRESSSYASINAALRPIFKPMGYVSYAQFERAWEDTLGNPPWPRRVAG